MAMSMIPLHKNQSKYSLPCGQVYQEKKHVSDPDVLFIFNLHGEPLFSRIQIHVISKSKMHVMYKEKRKKPFIGKAVPCS
jgi:hypothetical protein